jgi:hypothetical protein
MCPPKFSKDSLNLLEPEKSFNYHFQDARIFEFSFVMVHCASMTAKIPKITAVPLIMEST